MALFRSFRPFTLPRLTRSYETAGTLYPFNPSAQLIPPPSLPVSPKLKRGKGLMIHLRQNSPTERTQKLLQTFFARRSANRIVPGSILHLTLKRAPFSFSGVLMEIRHKGPDSSFVLRNVVHRTGVEMRFTVGSENIVDMQVQRSEKRRSRSRLFYLRDDPAKMNAISQGAKRRREREEKREKEKKQLEEKGKHGRPKAKR